MNKEESKNNLKDDERLAIRHYLLRASKDDKKKQGIVKELAAMYGVLPNTVTRIWKCRKSSGASGDVVADMSSRMKGCLMGNKIDPSAIIYASTSVLVMRRSRLSHLQSATGISKSTFHRMTQNGTTKRPALTDSIKNRFQFCLCFVRKTTVGEVHYFDSMTYHVNIDEK